MSRKIKPVDIGNGELIDVEYVKKEIQLPDGTTKIYRRPKLVHPITRICEQCGNAFSVEWKSDLEKRFCNQSCSASWRMSQPEIKAKVHTKEMHIRIGKKRGEWLRNTEKGKKELERIRNLNPMANEETRKKVSEKLREMHHKPKVRGGNGKGLTIPQEKMFETLKGYWIPELAISLGKRQDGYPTCYKVDLGNPYMRMAIEIDGNSHYSRKQLDEKKDAKLLSLGWTVLRFRNEEIIEWINDGMIEESEVSKRLRTYGIDFGEADCDNMDRLDLEKNQMSIFDFIGENT